MRELNLVSPVVVDLLGADFSVVNASKNTKPFIANPTPPQPVTEYYT